MTASPPHRTRRLGRCCAFTLAETIVSAVLVGGLLVVALNTVGDMTVGEQMTRDRSRGHLFAQDLMAEIMRQPYEDPDDTPAYGLESGELSGSRDGFDDVDDYHAWIGSPPQYKNGTEIPDLDGWHRKVAVHRMDPDDLMQVLGTESGVKRITITVSYNGKVTSESVGIRSLGLPPPKLGPTVLFVVSDRGTLTAQETLRKDLLESWDWGVELINASASQAEFDAAAGNANVAYVSEQVPDTVLGTKLAGATIGVVNEEPELTEEFGIVYYVYAVGADKMYVDDNSHYITSLYDQRWLTLCSSGQPMFFLDAAHAPDASILSRIQYLVTLEPGLAAIEEDGILYDGSNAAGRRVQLPWAAPGFDFGSLTADGQTILKRAIEWAANLEEQTPLISCGDGMCHVGEDSCVCPDDCGPPHDFEQPDVSCADGVDNDCDGSADCDDINCTMDPSCGHESIPPPVCPNGACESGEDCLSCPADCPGQSGGAPSLRYCCGNGVLEPAEGDGTICDGNP